MQQSLQEQVAAIEGRTKSLDMGPVPTPLWRFGVPAIDKLLPHGGLDFANVHEILWPHQADRVAAIGCVLALITKNDGAGPVLWCQSKRNTLDHGFPYAHGIGAMGMTPGRILFLSLKNDKEILWALEEALKSRALAAVMGEVETDLKSSRRLGLAASTGKTPCFILHTAREGMNTAARTRWLVRAAPRLAGKTMGPQSAEACGSWHLELLRNRQGKLGYWMVEWYEKTRHFSLAATLADQSTDAGGEKTGASQLIA